MTPEGLRSYLLRLVDHRVMSSVMIWGPPGVGKSSVVAQVAAERDLELVDLRLSQLAPTDLRGLPVPENGVSRWYPPEFLPRAGRGVLLLDELNLAPPALQGIAQQLVLDRRVGLYTVPPGWFVWAAGNRKEDRAAVFDMPSPLANRFLHLGVGPDLESFRAHAVARGLHEQIIAFLAFRPPLLHRLDPHHPAWPSPRSWELASRLHVVGLRVGPAVGGAAEAEFEAFVAVYERLACVDAVLSGAGRAHAFPDEPSLRYAVCTALALRPTTVDESLAALRWLRARAAAEWAQLWASVAVARLRTLGLAAPFAAALRADADLAAFLRDYQAMLATTRAPG